MKRFVERSFLFCLAAISISFIFTLVIYGINRKLYGRIKIDKGIKTIIVGDSHTACSINDSLMSETLNVSLLSEGYFFSFLKLENILDNNDNIKNVILGFSYHNLSAHYERFEYGTPVFNSINRYIPLMGLKDLFTLLSKQSSITNLVPIIKGSLSNILKYIKKGNPSILKDEIPYVSAGADNISINSRIGFLYYYDADTCTVSKFNTLYLKKIVALCRSRKINLTLLNSPLYEAFYSEIPACKKQEFDGIVHDLDVPFIDMKDFNLPADCYLPDGDHLNRNGSKITTEYLMDYLKKETFRDK